MRRYFCFFNIQFFLAISIFVISLQSVSSFCNQSEYKNNARSSGMKRSFDSYCNDSSLLKDFNSIFKFPMAIDSKNKILMDSSPKADGTVYKKMFLHHLGNNS